MFKTVKLYMLV